jgi:hypothetical protein
MPPSDKRRMAPADRRREALEQELLRMQEKPIVEVRAWWLSIYAIATMAIVLIAAVAVVIVLIATS